MSGVDLQHPTGRRQGASDKAQQMLARVLAQIAAAVAVGAPAPTDFEIARAIGAGDSSVHRCIDQMIAEGRLRLEVREQPLARRFGVVRPGGSVGWTDWRLRHPGGISGRTSSGSGRKPSHRPSEVDERLIEAGLARTAARKAERLRWAAQAEAQVRAARDRARRVLGDTFVAGRTILLEEAGR